MPRASGWRPVALTFTRHRSLGPDEPIVPTLSTLGVKTALLKAQGLVTVMVVTFTAEFARHTGRDFASTVLHDLLGARRVVVGEDFRFGANRSCGVAELIELGREFGFSVDPVPPVSDHGVRISSGGIRRAVADGNLEMANRWLGRPFSLSGQVVEGRRVGRTLGFPTANLQVVPEQLIPAVGVYAGATRVDDHAYRCVVNVGPRPTLHNGEDITIEAHLLDFVGDLYGQTLTLDWLGYLRGEQAFSDLDALRAQIAADCHNARNLDALWSQ